MINDYLRIKNDHLMLLEPTDEEEIHNLVSQFSLKRSMDYHDINMHCIKYIIASITKPLMHICNMSFNIGIFPDEMIIASVIPIFKNKDENEYENYRPISILSKNVNILEKLCKFFLNKYIKKFIL